MITYAAGQLRERLSICRRVFTITFLVGLSIFASLWVRSTRHFDFVAGYGINARTSKVNRNVFVWSFRGSWYLGYQSTWSPISVAVPKHIVSYSVEVPPNAGCIDADCQDQWIRQCPIRWEMFGVCSRCQSTSHRGSNVQLHRIVILSGSYRLLVIVSSAFSIISIYPLRKRIRAT